MINVLVKSTKPMTVTLLDIILKYSKELNVVRVGDGDVTEADIELAYEKDAIIIYLDVDVTEEAKNTDIIGVSLFELKINGVRPKDLRIGRSYSEYLVLYEQLRGNLQRNGKEVAKQIEDIARQLPHRTKTMTLKELLNM